MRVDSMFFEFKVNGQTAENIEAATHPGDEQIFATLQLVEDGQVKFHFVSSLGDSSLRLSILNETLIPRPFGIVVAEVDPKVHAGFERH